MKINQKTFCLIVAVVCALIYKWLDVCMHLSPQCIYSTVYVSSHYVMCINMLECNV